MTGDKDSSTSAPVPQRLSSMPIGLARSEQTAVQAQFGVSAEQVRRDHLISHLLGAISRMDDKRRLVFFGGTALSRTLLPDLRLSEDIDLITTSNRSAMASAIMAVFENGLARSHGEIEWLPALDKTQGSEPAVLRVSGPIQVQIQLLSSTGYPAWPTTTVTIEQRYSDAPPAELTVLTPAAFVAAKMSAWLDRRSARDLYDLWALGNQGLINTAALDLFKRFGPTGTSPTSSMFANPPSQSQWESSLSHQGLIKIGPAEAASSLTPWWAAV